jgi:hypothetical protein
VTGVPSMWMRIFMVPSWASGAPRTGARSVVLVQVGPTAQTTTAATSEQNIRLLFTIPPRPVAHAASMRRVPAPVQRRCWVKNDVSLSYGIRSVRSYRSMCRAPGTTTSSLHPLVRSWTVSLKYRECARSPVISRMRRGAISSRWLSAPALM